MTQHQRLLAEELIDRARQLRIVNPYVLHGERLLRDFEARQLPIVFIDSDTKLRYLNESETLRPLVFEFENTITLSALLKGEILEVNIFALFKDVFQRNGFPHEHEGIASIFGQNEDSLRTEGDNLSFETGPLSSSDAAIASELIYSLSCFLTIYERYFNTHPDSVNEAKGIKKAALHAIPIYVFGIPRALVVCPHIAQHELNMMMSAITMGLERLVWDVFITRTSSRIRDKLSVSGAVRENLDVLIPPCDWDRLGFPVREVNITMGEAVLRIGFPIIDGELKSDLIIQQKNLCDRIGTYFETWDSVRKAILNETLRAGIAAIMGRNMSHNLGSHAIGHLAGFLSSATQSVILERYSMEQISDYFRYLQKRMDFIAQISTSSPSWCQSTNWLVASANTHVKDGVISEFRNQKCLLDNIARSEKIVLIRDEYEQIGLLNIEANIVGGGARVVEIPHGQVGAQALYSILENIIRNSAKHGSKPVNVRDRHLQLKLILDPNWGDPAWEDVRRRWRDEYIKVTIRDNAKAPEGTKKDLNDYLAAEIIDPETAKLKTGKWGLKEIKICAAYLRLVRQEEIDQRFKEWADGENGNDDPNKNPPIVRVEWEEALTIGTPKAAGEARLGYIVYEFFLLRPKEAVIVGGPELPQDKDDFEHVGIEFFDRQNFQTRVEDGDPLRHQFVVLYSGHFSWEWLLRFRKSLPCRVLIVGESDIPANLFEACQEHHGDTARLREDLQRGLEFVAKNELSSLTSADTLRVKLRSLWVKKRYGVIDLYVRNGLDKQITFDDIGVYYVPQSVQEHEDSKKTRVNDWEYQPSAEGARACVYDHIGDGTTHGVDDPEEPGHKLFATAAFHECLDNGSARGLLEDVPTRIEKDGTLPPSLKADLLYFKEASIVSVAVLDERVYEKAKADRFGIGTSKYSDNVGTRRTFAQAWEKRHVYLMDNDPAEKKFLTFVRRQAKRVRELHEQGILREPCYDFIVVHEGILEKARRVMISDSKKYPTSAEAKADFEIAWNQLKSLARHTVISTGRGRPDTAQLEQLRWVEFSNLADAVMRGCKVDVASLLFALQTVKGDALQ